MKSIPCGLRAVLPMLVLLSLLGDSPVEAGPDIKIFAWERGIGLEPAARPDMKVYLWFYEWNMFGAVSPEQHSRGVWENQVSIGDDGQSAEIASKPHFRLEAKAVADGAVLTLTATNQSGRDWPELAGIIACFNPGPAPVRNRELASKTTWFPGKKGLVRLDARTIYWNEILRKKVEAEANANGRYAWSEKWPRAEVDSTGGLIIRESNDGTWSAAIAWSRFLSCQGHNPWECMHLGIHLGPLEKGESRKVRGRIYLVPEGREKVFQRYRKEFEPVAQASSP